MTRLNLYAQVHKGLRSALVGAGTLIARTDFTRPDEARACAAALRTLFAFLDEHAEHEDAQILPYIARFNPELDASLHADHTRLHGLQLEIESTLSRLDGARADERASLGERLHERMWRLVADQLGHLATEESSANRALWAHLTDEELVAIHGKIVGAIPPARLADWFELMLPALHVGERSTLLRDLQGALPPQVFESLIAPARAKLGAAEWNRTLDVARTANHVSMREHRLAS